MRKLSPTGTKSCSNKPTPLKNESNEPFNSKNGRCFLRPSANPNINFSESPPFSSAKTLPISKILTSSLNRQLSSTFFKSPSNKLGRRYFLSSAIGFSNSTSLALLEYQIKF